MAAGFDAFDKSGGEDIGVKRGGVAHFVEPHVVKDVEDEGGGAADARVVEGVILNSYFPDGLKFLGLVYGVLQDGGVGEFLPRHSKILAVLCYVGVWGGR